MACHGRGGQATACQRTGMREIDRDSRANPWQQIAADLRARITAGEFGPDDPLPSLTWWEQETGVNRKTARKAYLQLIAEGLVEVIDGRGYFVKL